VNPIQRGAMMRRRDRKPVLSLPSYGALEAVKSHLGSEIPSHMPNVHSAWEGLSNRSKTGSLPLSRQRVRLVGFTETERGILKRNVVPCSSEEEKSTLPPRNFSPNSFIE